MTVREVLNYSDLLTRMIEGNSQIKATTKFKLLGMITQFKPVLENYESVRSEKIVQYGKTDENGNTIIPEDDKEAVEKFTKEITELLNSEIDIPITKLKADEIMNEGIPVPFLANIYGLIEE